MNKRDRWLKKREQNSARPAGLTSAPVDSVETGLTWERFGWLVAGVLMVALVVTLVVKKWPVPIADQPDTPIAKVTLPNVEGPIAPHSEEPQGHKPKVNSGEKGLPDNFLDAFNDQDAKDKEPDALALSNKALEKRFQALVEI